MIMNVCYLSLNIAHAQKHLSQVKELALQADLRGVDVEELVTSLVNGMDFQFIPATLNGQVNGVDAIYKYRNVQGFPLWSIINMGTPLLVDKYSFTVNSMEKREKEGVMMWYVNLSCEEDINGKFDLHFIIDAATGKAMVDIIQVEKGAVSASNDRGEETYKKNDSFLFQGYIFPKELLYSYKNEKEEKRVINSQKLLNNIVPRLNFRIGNTTINPTILERKFAKLVYMDKFNDKWYIRIEYPAGRSRKLKTPVSDFVIDTRTGESYVRGGSYDRLTKNWQQFKGSVIYTNAN